MAEFVEVMRQLKRLCKECSKLGAEGWGCDECPLERYNSDLGRDGCDYVSVASGDDDNLVKVEQIIMNWAAKHPTRYPTWREWQEHIFPDYSLRISPCIFGNANELALTCGSTTCNGCADRPIPAKIAEKLGIEPIE